MSFVDIDDHRVIQEDKFYDDRTGLNADIKKEYASFQDKCSQPFSVARKLIETEVRRLGNFGAVQTKFGLRV